MSWSLFEFEMNTNQRVPEPLRSKRLDAEFAASRTAYPDPHRCRHHQVYPDSGDYCRGEPGFYCRTAHDEAIRADGEKTGLPPFRKTTRRRWSCR